MRAYNEAIDRERVGDTEGARKKYLEALKHNSLNVLPRFGLDNLLETQERDGEAVLCYLQALRAFPNLWTPRYRLAAVLDRAHSLALSVTAMPKEQRSDIEALSKHANIALPTESLIPNAPTSDFEKAALKGRRRVVASAEE